MLLTIPKSERGIFEKACAELDLNCDFYTNEVNDQILKCEIVIDRVKHWDISLQIAFQVGRAVEQHWQDEMNKTYKK